MDDPIKDVRAGALERQARSIDRYLRMARELHEYDPEGMLRILDYAKVDILKILEDLKSFFRDYEDMEGKYSIIVETYTKVIEKIDAINAKYNPLLPSVSDFPKDQKPN